MANEHLQKIKTRLVEKYGDPADLNALARLVISEANEKYAGCYVLRFAWEMRWRVKVSNSHSAPINGVQNWGSDPDVSKGYPGWTGRVWIRFNQTFPSFGSDSLQDTLTYTGTGGIDSYDGPWTEITSAFYTRAIAENKRKRDIFCYSWDYKIFASDWPLLAHDIEKAQVAAILANGHFSPPLHKFKWEDTDVLAADQKVIYQQQEA